MSNREALYQNVLSTQKKARLQRSREGIPYEAWKRETI